MLKGHVCVRKPTNLREFYQLCQGQISSLDYVRNLLMATKIIWLRYNLLRNIQSNICVDLCILLSLFGLDKIQSNFRLVHLILSF